MGAVVSCIKNVLRAIGNAIVAVFSAIGTAITAIVNGVINVLITIVDFLTCRHTGVGRHRRTGRRARV